MGGDFWQRVEETPGAKFLRRMRLSKPNVDTSPLSPPLGPWTKPAESGIDAAMRDFEESLGKTRRAEVDFYRGVRALPQEPPAGGPSEVREGNRPTEITDEMLAEARRRYRENPQMFSGWPGEWMTLGELAEQQGLNKPTAGYKLLHGSLRRRGAGNRRVI